MDVASILSLYTLTSGGSRNNERGSKLTSAQRRIFGVTPTSGHTLCSNTIGKIPFSARGSPIIDFEHSTSYSLG